MFGKRFEALIIAVLLAFTLAISAAPLAAPPTALAAECDSTTGGGG